MMVERDSLNPRIDQVTLANRARNTQSNQPQKNELAPAESRGDVRTECGQVSEVDMALIALLAGGRLRNPVTEKRYSLKNEKKQERGKTCN